MTKFNNRKNKSSNRHTSNADGDFILKSSSNPAKTHNLNADNHNQNQENFFTERKSALKNQDIELPNSGFVASKSKEIDSKTLETDNNLLDRAPAKKSQFKVEDHCSLDNGLKYYQQKDYEKCIASFEQALCLDPQNIQINYWLGMSYYQLHQMDESIKYFVRVVPSEDWQSGYVETFFWLGEIYRQQKKLKQASENYQKLLLLAPNCTYASLAFERLASIRFAALFD